MFYQRRDSALEILGVYQIHRGKRDLRAQFLGTAHKLQKTGGGQDRPSFFGGLRRGRPLQRGD